MSAPAIDEYRGAAQVVLGADAGMMRGVLTEEDAHHRTRCTVKTHRGHRKMGTNARTGVCCVPSDPYILTCLHDAAAGEAKRLRNSEDADEQRAAREFAKALREVEDSGERVIAWRAKRARAQCGRLL